jgi:hypothetical protein
MAEVKRDTLMSGVNQSAVSVQELGSGRPSVKVQQRSQCPSLTGTPYLPSASIYFECMVSDEGLTHSIDGLTRLLNTP